MWHVRFQFLRMHLKRISPGRFVLKYKKVYFGWLLGRQRSWASKSRAILVDLPNNLRTKTSSWSWICLRWCLLCTMASHHSIWILDFYVVFFPGILSKSKFSCNDTLHTWLGGAGGRWSFSIVQGKDLYPPKLGEMIPNLTNHMSQMGFWQSQKPPTQPKPVGHFGWNLWLGLGLLQPNLWRIPRSRHLIFLEGVFLIPWVAW